MAWRRSTRSLSGRHSLHLRVSWGALLVLLWLTAIESYPTSIATAAGSESQPAEPSRAMTVEDRLLAGELPEEVLRDLRKLYPGTSDETLRTGHETMAVRATLAESFAADSTFGGQWYDYPNNLWTLQATDANVADSMAERAISSGVPSVGIEVERSYRELESTRQQVEQLVAGRATRYGLSVDVRSNAVLLQIEPGSDVPASLVSPFPDVIVEVSDDLPQGQPTACFSRYNCGVPARGGVNIGRSQGGSTLTGCSVGFTLSATDGSRWLYTAGHCISQAQVDARVNYGHGEQNYGYARDTRDIGAVDAARVRIANPYWLQAGGGYTYRTPTAVSDIHYAIIYASTVSEGQTVCVSGRNHSPGDDNCGAVTAENLNGLPQVSGVKVCGGDSGGSTYLLANGQRWAYGLISQSSAHTNGSCTGNDGQVSWSNIPHINAWMDGLTTARVRVEVR